MELELISAKNGSLVVEEKEESKSLFDVLLGSEPGGSSKSDQWSLDQENDQLGKEKSGSGGNDYFFDSMSGGSVKSFTGEINSDPNKKIPICDQDTETGQISKKKGLPHPNFGRTSLNQNDPLNNLGFEDENSPNTEILDRNQAETGPGKDSMMCLPSQTNFDDKKLNFGQSPMKNPPKRQNPSINSNLAIESKTTLQKSGPIESKLSLGNSSNKNNLLHQKIPGPTRTSIFYSTEDPPDLREGSLSKAQDIGSNSHHTPSPHYRSRQSDSIASDSIDYAKSKDALPKPINQNKIGNSNEGAELLEIVDSTWQEPARIDSKAGDFFVIDTGEIDKD